jgi:D-proline reductase (dithiol) PrdB
MGTMSEFSLSLRLFLKALSESRLALLSSAGFVVSGQEPFDDAVRGGDVSFRDIPADVDVRTLVDTHRSESFDHAGLREDPNVAFPIDRIRELAERGRIRSVNHRHLSFMGSITAPGRLVRHTGPEAARRLVADGVDVALLVPV